MKNLLINLLLSLLVALFFYTGISKLVNLAQFRNELGSQVFPKWLVPWLVFTIPLAEIVTAGGLLFTRTRIVSLWSSIVMMSLFTLYSVLVLFNVFYKTPCPCGGLMRHLSWRQHFVFNLFFLLISVIAIKLCMHTNRETETLKKQV